MRGRERHLVVDTAFRIAIYGLVASLVARDGATFVWLLQGLLLVSAAVSILGAYREGEPLARTAFTRWDQWPPGSRSSPSACGSRLGDEW